MRRAAAESNHQMRRSPVTVQELRATLTGSKPPDGVDLLVEALWWEAKGNWSRAHEIAQDLSSSNASSVHAYLHRKEGDASNAGYWYRRAGKSHVQQTLETEWDDIAEALLTRQDS
jgi:hypothetical protein